MAYPAYIREKARELRTEKKLTIDELADRLAISRTTIYYWVRDLPIRTDGDSRPWPHIERAQEHCASIHRARRAAGLRAGPTPNMPALLKEPTFRDFVCMYIGEGYKRNRNVVSICNSDPAGDPARHVPGSAALHRQSRLHSRSSITSIRTRTSFPRIEHRRPRRLYTAAVGAWRSLVARAFGWPRSPVRIRAPRLRQRSPHCACPLGRRREAGGCSWPG